MTPTTGEAQARRTGPAAEAEPRGPFAGARAKARRPVPAAEAQGRRPAPIAEAATPTAPSAPAAETREEEARAAVNNPPPVDPAPAPAQQTIKYMHPANRKMVWSGEGEQPEWVTAYLASGGSWTALANAAEKLLSWQR